MFDPERWATWLAHFSDEARPRCLFVVVPDFLHYTRNERGKIVSVRGDAVLTCDRFEQ